MKSYIISYGRSDNVISRSWNKTATIVVPESQYDDYKKNYDNVMAIPDDEDGNCAKKKNAVLRRSIGHDTVIIDDDIGAIGYFENGELITLTEKEWNGLCLTGFQMCKDLGTPLWGLNMQSDKKFYKEYAPFSLSRAVLGPVTCISDNDGWAVFDEELWLKEDYDLSIRTMFKFGKIIRFNKYHYRSAHITNKGGLRGKRNYIEETRQLELLQKKYGSKVVDIKRKTQNGNETINPIIRMPIKGI